MKITDLIANEVKDYHNFVASIARIRNSIKRGKVKASSKKYYIIAYPWGKRNYTQGQPRGAS